MRTLYIADDGTEFDDEWECENHEWRYSHKMDDVTFYDKYGNELEDKVSEDTYNDCAKIVVESEEGVEDIQALVDYTGFLGYESIDSPGTWIFNNDPFDPEFKLEEEVSES